MLEKLSLEYIAGLFDGEGCIGLYRSKGGTRDFRFTDESKLKPPSWIRVVTIAGTYLPTLKIFKQMFGGRVRQVKSANSEKNLKTTYEWIIGAKKDIINFLETIAPFLQEKKVQAILMLDFVKSVPLDHDKGFRIMEELKKLKKVSYDL